MKEVPLSKGQVALVDDEDFDRVMTRKWHVGSRNCKGVKNVYAQSTTNGPRRTIMMHRFVMGLSEGDPEIDHRDRDGLNNQKYNLRTATREQQMRNRGPMVGRDVKCIYRNGPNGNWIIRMKNKYRGTFLTLTAAIHAYNKMAKAEDGEFAFLNPIP